MGNRSMKDDELLKEKAFPAAGGNNNSDSIYLGPITDRVENALIIVTIPANTILVATKTITAKLQSSADDSTFADIGALGSQAVTGLTGNGNARTELLFPIPTGTKAYLRANVAVQASGGALTGLKYELAVAF